MVHETPLITTIVAGLVLAFILGALANRLRLPPLVGYLFAGVLVGPHTPGFIADQDLATQLAELGVILLMFGVGLHFSLRDLMSVRALAIPGAVVQIGLATALGLGLGLLMGWTVPQGLLFGLALSVASTVVLLKALQDRRLIETERGRIAVGWLIVEDFAMVLALVLIPAMATLLGSEGVQVHDPFVTFVERIVRSDVGVFGIIGLTMVKIAAFVGFMLIVGRRVIPWGLHAVAHTGNRELFRLAVLAIALGVALGSAYLFGVSLALGAFFAGMILSESELSHRAAQETLPLRDAFAVLFFVSVGMLFDPSIIIRDPLPVLATLFIIVIGKSLAAFFIVIAFHRPVSTALVIAASLAQIGEFSFILAELGLRLNLLPAEGRDLILAGAILSIVLNPLVFWGLDRLRPLIEARTHHRRGTRPEAVEPVLVESGAEPAAPAAEPEESEPDDEPHPTTLTGHTVLVGYGRVGRTIADGLVRGHTPLLVIEDADSRVAAARATGVEVVVGNAASADVLKLANLAGATSLVVAIPNSFEAGQATEQGRKLNPGLRIIARAHSDEEEHHLTHLGADGVIMGEREIALGMLAWLKADGAAAAAAPVLDVEAGESSGARLDPSENLLVALLPTREPGQHERPLAPGPLTAGPLTETQGDDAFEAALAEEVPELQAETTENEAVVAVEPASIAILPADETPAPSSESDAIEAMAQDEQSASPQFDEDPMPQAPLAASDEPALAGTEPPDRASPEEEDRMFPEETTTDMALALGDGSAAPDSLDSPEGSPTSDVPESPGPDLVPPPDSIPAMPPEEIPEPPQELPAQDPVPDIPATPPEEFPSDPERREDGEAPEVKPEPRN